VPFMVESVLLAVAGALILCVAGLAALVCLTMTAEVDAKLTADLEARIRAPVSARSTCGQDGAVISMVPGNCHDRSGFRVVTGDRIRVFSLRYSKPLFIFGLENGMISTNEKIPRTLLASERSAFIWYANNAR